MIQKNKLLNLEDRAAVEFMYLILTRCLNNISVINDKIAKEKQSTALAKLQGDVNLVYRQIVKAHQRYS